MGAPSHGDISAPWAKISRASEQIHEQRIAA
jgi:hypothetical protein